MKRTFITLAFLLGIVQSLDLVEKEYDRVYEIPEGWIKQQHAKPFEFVTLTFAIKQSNLDNLEV